MRLIARKLILIFLVLPVVFFVFALSAILFFSDLVDGLARIMRPRGRDRSNRHTANNHGIREKNQYPESREERILIIQSADPAHVLRILDQLGRASFFRFPRYTIFCRNRPEILRPFTGNPALHEVLTHSETQGWWQHLRSFRREHFDAVVVFFTGDPSYWKVKCFAFLIGARRKLIFDENNRCLLFFRSGRWELYERDLVFCGVFQSDMFRRHAWLRWTAGRYWKLRAWMGRGGAIGIPGQPLPVDGISPADRALEPPSPEEIQNDQASLAGALTAQTVLANAKRMLTSLSSIALRSLLSSQAGFRLPTAEEPEVSVILVLYNRAELTLQCLRSLAENGCEALEIIIVDNASSDDTPSLLDRIEGAKIVRNAENIHFLLASNQGAREARGRYLLFLNNDTQVLPGSIRAAVKSLEASNDIGAVGGKLILPDGSLQETGSIIWRDGSCLGYGRGDDPFAPMYMFRRDVDYCSGAFLLTRRETFMSLGGFDEAYRPFYYEETDYCLRLWEHGLRVVYEPEATLLHYEFASSSSPDEAKEFHARHQGIFFDRHRLRLQLHYEPGEKNLLRARSSSTPRRRVLFIDDRVPHPSLGSGFPRSNAILSTIAKLGYLITYYPTAVVDEEWRDVYVDIPREVEVMLGYGPAKLEQFFASRAGYYDIILISRPHNMQYLRPIYETHADWFQGARLIYDAEAVFSIREAGFRRLQGETFSEREIEQLTKSEVELASIADSVISVSPFESDAFARHGIDRVHVLGHAVAISPTPRQFQDRSGFLFVGAVQGETSPNGDAVLWFVREILPLIRQALGPVPVILAGMNCSDIIAGVSDDRLQVLGRVEDLSPIYDAARVFVAPTRFAAGIPHKIHEAAARGVPVVATTLLARQLDWRDGEQLLVADEPRTFADQCIRLYRDAECWGQIRSRALDRVRLECSPESFEATLKSIFDGDESTRR